MDLAMYAGMNLGQRKRYYRTIRARVDGRSTASAGTSDVYVEGTGWSGATGVRMKADERVVRTGCLKAPDNRPGIQGRPGR